MFENKAWPAKAEFRNAQIDHLCQFTNEVNKEALNNLWQMAVFKILEKYAEIEIDDPFGPNNENSEEFRKEILKYILIIEAIKKTIKTKQFK